MSLRTLRSFLHIKIYLVASSSTKSYNKVDRSRTIGGMEGQWREREQTPLVLLKEITVFSEMTEDSEAIAMEPQAVRNVATDGEEWIRLEAQDGTAGWIRVENGWFPSEEVECYELFTGLLLID